MAHHKPLYLVLNLLCALLLATMVGAAPSEPVATSRPAIPHPSAPKPEPASPMIINGTTPGVPVPDSGLAPYCVHQDPGNCAVSLELSYNSQIMDIFIWDHDCKLIGAGGNMAWDHDYAVSSELPWLVIVTPHYEGAPSEFWYAGAHYQNGWEHTQINDNVWYDRMPFAC